MYLNKLLFPGSHHRYQAKHFENELFFVIREKYPKNFKISRKETPNKSPEKKSPKSPGQKRFSSLFRCSKTSQSESKNRKNVESIYLEPNVCSKTIFGDSAGSPEKLEDPESIINMPSFLRLGSLRRDQGLIESPVRTHKKGTEEDGKDVKKNEEKIKKKKAKATCWSFLPKMHRDKKMFDGSAEPMPFELNFVPDLKALSPELIEAVGNANQNQVETEKESSSDSEDEATSSSKKFVQIPCLYIRARVVTNKTLLYFHGNGEDLCTAYDFFKNLSSNLMVNIIAVEYPGYGVYPGSPSEKKVLIDAEAVYNHLVNNFQIKEEDIYVFGRSIGSGPATWLASVKNPGLLILMSPFTSVKAVAKHIGGNIAKYLVKQRFNNIEFMEDVRCPVFIIHGKKDTLIPCSQAMQLYDVIKGKKKIYLAEEMTHSAFDFFMDISVPLTQWLKGLNLLSFESTLQDISKTFSNTQINIENIVNTQKCSFKLNEKYKSKDLL